MEITAASAAATTRGATPASADKDTTAGGALGKNEFLKLLTTQMSNQDPLEPMDSTAMIAQLAQFSALEQMENLNTQFESFRRDNGMALSYMLCGEQIELALSSGETVQGVVDKVSWQDDEAVIEMNGEAYPFSSIISLQKMAASDETTGALAEETAGASTDAQTQETQQYY